MPADPGKISEATVKALLKDPVFTNTLDQRQLISKLGVDKLGAFAKADPANREFLAGLLKNTQVMDMFLEAAGPTPIADRDKNSYTVSAEALDIWRKISNADPDSKGGIYQKLAIATAIAPPGSRTGGAGGANQTPAEPVGRYKHFKSAHKNNELFPSFNNLTVWEYTKVVSSHASDADLAWAREMINTWRPDLRIREQVVNSTSEVWRRASPWPYTNGFKSVLEGGGKCGPRSSWAVMICQAFGIPAIGVGQPSHACVAARSAYPEMGPQPGSVWKVHQGAGWQVSKLEGTSGTLFLEAVEERSHAAEFSQIEHLRWLASALASKVQADAVMSVAAKLRPQATPQQAAAKATPPAESEADPKPASLPEAPFKVVPGVLHVEAESFSKMSGVSVYDCFTGGKQVNFQKNINESWLDYTVDVPAAGTYKVEMRVALANRDQVLDISSGTDKLATISMPNTYGLWTTQAAEIKLKQGTQVVRISAPYQRGIALRWLELKSKATNK
ncbi:MAG: carbohydrate-binding protein [Planctomycetota bacterium]|nr:carbohydrate-binding protein [Planctomycetota bacterium]